MLGGVVIKTVVNGMIFDGHTKDPIQQTVRDALIAFMAAMAGRRRQQLPKKLASWNCRREGRGSDLPRSEVRLRQKQRTNAGFQTKVLSESVGSLRLLRLKGNYPLVAEH